MEKAFKDIITLKALKDIITHREEKEKQKITQEYPSVRLLFISIISDSFIKTVQI